MLFSGGCAVGKESMAVFPAGGETTGMKYGENLWSASVVSGAGVGAAMLGSVLLFGAPPATSGGRRSGSGQVLRRLGSNGCRGMFICGRLRRRRAGRPRRQAIRYTLVVDRVVWRLSAVQQERWRLEGLGCEAS